MIWAGRSGGEDGRFDSTEEATWREHYDSGSYFLVIDDVDRSDILESCHTQSGYVRPTTATDPAVELDEKQAIADATKGWIDCAHKAGATVVDETTVRADAWATRPRAVIPYATTGAQFRDLLEACPNFDEEAAKVMTEPEFDPATYTHRDPGIEIEDIGDTYDTHYQELDLIRYEKQVAFWESLETD
jgi:hypothetical protein